MLGAALALLGVQVNAQNVNVSGALVGNGTYTTLGGAFTAINGGAQTGATIIVDIVSNTNEASATATLNAGAWTSMLIRPQGGSWIVSGATTAGSPMIDLNGADNVTINGLNTGGNALTIENTTASATSGTSTIRFIGGATGNTITNCTLRGACSSSVATNGATIFFSTDANTANGNDNNTISNNDIGPSGANLPTKAILGNGSASTTAIGNSGITITNNNIFDFFGAAVTSSGVAINGGCNTWSITNNRFYQTATRTWTTGSIHRAIDLNSSTSTSGVQAMTVTGNIVGYAASNQTGTYTLTGTGTGAKFHGIFFNGISTGTASTVSNNTVASVSMTGVTGSGTSTSSPFTAMLLQEGVFTSNNNSIGSQGASAGLTFSTTTTSSTDVYGIYNFSSNAWTSNSNQVGGISVTNLGASGTFVLYGMRAFTGSTVTWNALNNTIGGTVSNSIQLNATGTSSQVIGMFTSNCPVVLTSNTIQNLTSNIGTGTTTGASVIGINITTSTPNHTVSQNTIFNLSNTNATAASVVTGIQFTGSTANVVERNLIHGLTVATNSASAEVNGIRVAGGTTTYRNNMIALGAGISNAIGAAASNSGTTGINGINEALGTDNFYHNSVYIGGTATAGSGASYAFNGTQTVNTRAFRDNIFQNARSNSGATGSHYAIKINGTVANPTGLTINNNLYFANGTGGVFGFFNGLDVGSIAAWRTAVGQDAGSFQSNPQYNGPTNATPDLHLHPTLPTVAEGNGVSVGVTDDYDGQTRASFTPVDIGADAGNFVGVDLSAPAITYTALSSTCALTDVTLTATITDATGVPTSGGLQPRIYFRKNAGTWFSSQGSLASGTGTNGTWNFTIVVASMGGVAVSDAIQYYVIAQDNLGNVTSNPPTGLVATDVNTVTTAPTTPNSYSIQNTLVAGTYNIPGDFATLTAAVAAYNTSCLTGAVVFQLAAGYTSGSETFPITVNANAFASATNTLTIRPASGQTPTISGSVASGALIKLNGADYVIIDGSNSGGTDRSLTITNTNTTAPCAIWLSSLGNGAGATNNTVKNCNLNTSAATTATAYGISVSGATIGSAGGDNDNVTIQNNAINSQNVGLYANGNAAVSAGGMDGLTVSGNSFSATTTIASSITYGVQVANALTAMINANSFNLTTSATNAPVAISIESNVSGSSVLANQITQCFASNSGGYGGRGITVGTGLASSNITIANNFIAGVNGTNWSSFGNNSSMGIAIGMIGNSSTVTTTAGGINLYHNTVNMTGSMGSGSSSALTAALYVGSGASSLNVRNNIFVNTQTATSTTQKNYAVYSVAANTAFTPMSYNDIFVSNSFNAGSALLGFLSSDQSTFSGFNTTFGASNMQNIAPVFTSATDLHLVPASNAALNDLGVSGTGITVDIDGTTRSATPDMGADEFTPPSCTTATGGTATGSTAFCVSGTPTITSTGYSIGLGTTYQWYSSTNAVDYPAGGSIVSGQTNPASLTTGVVSTTTYYWLRVGCATDASVAYSNMITITINPNPVPTVTPSSTASFCVSGTLSSSVASTYAWSPSGGSAQTATITSSGSYSVTVTDANGCSGTSAPVVVTVSAQPTAVSVTPATPAAFCQGGNVALAASGGSYTSNGTLNFGTQAAQNTAVVASTDYPAPFSIYYGGQRMQMLIRASELTAAGFTAGTVFDGINFPVVSFGSGWPGTVSSCQNFQVRFGFTTATTITTFQTLATTVRPAANFTPTVGYNNVLTFSTLPGAWNGTDNIIIETTFSNNITGTTSTTVTQYNSPAGFASCVVYRVDATAAATVAAATTPTYTYTSRPDFRLTGSATAQAPYTWSPGTGLNTTTGPNVTASPNAPGQTYTVTATNGACTSTANVDVVVNPLPTVACGGPYGPLCSNAAAIALTGSPVGGTWSGTGVSGSTFDPSVSGAGSFTLTYNYTDGNGCSNSCTTSITVNAAPVVTCGGPYGPVCINAGTIALSGSPVGGTWSGTGVTGSDFDPSVSGAGTFTLLYSYTDGNGCSNSCTTSITVNPLPVVTCPANITGICSSDVAFALTGGNPSGGIYSGPGVSGGNFDPAVAGAGTHTITYSYTDGNGCSNSCQFTIAVTAATTWYSDLGDSDGLGDPNVSLLACTQPTGYVADNSDLCPTTAGTVGSPCNDGNPFTAGDAVQNDCSCAGTPVPCDNWTLTINTDANGSETTWQMIDAASPFVLASGGPYASNSTNTETICVPQGACFNLTFNDAGNNGMSSGGWLLVDNNGRRILDNVNNGGCFLSSSSTAEPFCNEPASAQALIATQCDKENWLPNDVIIASANAAVSAQWGIGDQTDDGYQFWFQNPCGGYTRKIFRNHATSGGNGPANALRATKLALNTIVSNPLPVGTLLNVRVRTRVNGVNGAWGPACRFRIDPNACTLTKLNDIITDPHFSCGATGKVVNAGGDAGKIFAKVVTSGGNPATHYRFEISNPVQSYLRYATNTSAALVLGQWATNPLLCGTWTYNVRVQASFDGGNSYCPYGDVCTVTITNNLTGSLCTAPGAFAGNSDRALELGNGVDMNMYPNPNRGEQLFINLRGFSEEVNEVGVEIYDGFGKRVVNRMVPAQDGYMNTTLELDHDFAAGIYMVHLTAGELVRTERLVIQR